MWLLTLKILRKSIFHSLVNAQSCLYTFPKAMFFQGQGREETRGGPRRQPARVLGGSARAVPGRGYRRGGGDRGGAGNGRAASALAARPPAEGGPGRRSRLEGGRCGGWPPVGRAPGARRAGAAVRQPAAPSVRAAGGPPDTPPTRGSRSSLPFSNRKCTAVGNVLPGPRMEE